MARAKGTPPVLTLVPKEQDVLRGKLDSLALDIAESLMSHQVPTAERIAGLRALTAYWQTDQKHSGQTAAPVESAFDRYRREQDE